MSVVKVFDYYNYLMVEHLGKYHDFFSSLDERGYPFHEINCLNWSQVWFLQTKFRKQIIEQINTSVGCQLSDVIIITNSDYIDLKTVRIYFTSQELLMMYKLMGFEI